MLVEPDPLLKNICLPASHDSGAYWLSNTVSPGPGSPDWLRKLLNKLSEIANKIDSIPGIGAFIPDPAAWVTSAAIPAIRGLSVTNHRTIAAQLNDGVRCFDLRICRDESGVYCVYHGLIGTHVSELLDQFATFLTQTSGEILYICMGDFAGFTEPDHARFAALVKEKLGPYAYAHESNVSNDPFNESYSDIINQSGTKMSRAILVNGPSSDDPVFWPDTYNPAYNEFKAGAETTGFYTKTTNLNYMIETQTDQFQSANGKPFALYLTLTPSEEDAIKIVLSSLAKAIAKLGLWISLTNPYVGGLVLSVAATLKVYSWSLAWHTVEELSRNVNRDAFDIATTIQSVNPQPNAVTFIYTDFYEKTDLVDLAIMYSTGAVPPSWQDWASITAEAGGGTVKGQTGATVAAVWRPAAADAVPHLDIFITGTDGTVWWNWYEPTSGWQQWNSITAKAGGGTVKGMAGAAVAAAYRPGDPAKPHLDIFITGTDGTVWWNWYEPTSGWQQWNSITAKAGGGTVKGQAGATVAAVWRPAAADAVPHLDIFITGTDGTVWWNWYEPAKGWQQWNSITAKAGGGTVKGMAGAAVAATYRPGDPAKPHLDIFITGTDGTVWWNWYEPAKGWQQWNSITERYDGGTVKGMAGAPVAAAYRTGDPESPQLNIFITGTDGTVWWNWYEPTSGWQQWNSITAKAGGGTVKGMAGAGVAAAWNSAAPALPEMDLFITGTDGTVWRSWWGYSEGVAAWDRALGDKLDAHFG
jgi:hypothetical protein